ncbi:MAG: twin-arginine translocase TatA/TatE family subunit [Candidatus Levybacteria bacterium CG_4_9_14_3_um_filter_35_16]|nr:MAG: twin-arginine translocase TatA/TatE family subunit [Candidatus Levybacteria bacterium CG22_combo_CG10-13_8_21_14_all_35_11]PIY94361.1 MAG: twin-arginine translocase TatA/TatE family subunit [Candidatus Levybacteria bacterium CG_4_10_14_0_8_um_filter_35_23]PIZ98532.1 MAG: twin-arginine translocase TatA/TatE family subunit [Candidatus Levybacteria bacterium CG_4_10_14_0_2_um_filter_35_8]PJA91126.1 MAG: twin-arginine translocase TatA/TatE family subunit [Candidatus Levybacteria bacterium CG
MLNGIGTTEIVVVALVLLLLFGGKKLPELARGMGDSIKEFRKAARSTD